MTSHPNGSDPVPDVALHPPVPDTDLLADSMSSVNNWFLLKNWELQWRRLSVPKNVCKYLMYSCYSVIWTTIKFYETWGRKVHFGVEKGPGSSVPRGKLISVLFFRRFFSISKQILAEILSYVEEDYGWVRLIICWDRSIFAQLRPNFLYPNA